MSEQIILVYDTDLRRPACVLLQATMGGDRGAFNRIFGGGEHWLLAPTPGMKRLAATEEQWKQIAKMKPVK